MRTPMIRSLHRRRILAIMAFALVIGGAEVLTGGLPLRTPTVMPIAVGGLLAIFPLQGERILDHQARRRPSVGEWVTMILYWAAMMMIIICLMILEY